MAKAPKINNSNAYKKARLEANPPQLKLPPHISHVDGKILIELRNQAFDKQLLVIADKSKRIALHVGRRAGKTSTIDILYLMYALRYMNIRLVFIGISGESAENAFLPHAERFLKHIGYAESIHYTYNRTERLFTFKETGSTISLKGWDVSYKEMAKILGGNCFSVAIDEMQNQTQDTEQAIKQYIGPAVSDYLPIGGGSIFTLGTSGDYMGENFWYQICSSSNHLGWSYHTWLDKENPHMLKAKLIEDEEFLKQYGPGFEDLDWYKQQYRNAWITTGIRRVYQVDERNYTTKANIPAHFFDRGAGCIYGLGMDWGFSPDPMAFLVVCYNTRFSDKLYIIEEYKQTEMYISDINKKILELNDKYKFDFIVSDAGAQTKHMVADINKDYGNKYGYCIIPADKAGKQSHQNVLNSDFIAGRILIDKETCRQLINELENLVWDPIKLNTQNKREEKQGLANHLCDCALYAHFHSRHLWYSEPIKKQLPQTGDEWNLQMTKELCNKNKQKQLYSDINFATPWRSNVRS